MQAAPMHGSLAPVAVTAIYSFQVLGMTPPRRPFGPHVAVVYAVGAVVDGKGGGVLGARNEIASRTLSMWAVSTNVVWMS